MIMSATLVYIIRSQLSDKSIDGKLVLCALQ